MWVLRRGPLSCTDISYSFSIVSFYHHVFLITLCITASRISAPSPAGGGLLGAQLSYLLVKSFPNIYDMPYSFRRVLWMYHNPGLLAGQSCGFSREEAVSE